MGLVIRIVIRARTWKKKFICRGKLRVSFPLQPSAFCLVLVSCDLCSLIISTGVHLICPCSCKTRCKRENTETNTEEILRQILRKSWKRKYRDVLFSTFIADAAFLYLWEKLADRRDHPDDIYILPLKIRRYKINGKIKTSQSIFTLSYFQTFTFHVNLLMAFRGSKSFLIQVLDQKR